MNKSVSEAADIPEKPRKWFTIGLAFSLPAIIVLKMGFFFLLIGMIPTLLTSSLMRNSKGFIISTVAAFNFTGVFPELLSVTMQGGTPRAVLDQLSEPSVWYSMYGAAMLGIAIVWLSPSIAMLFLEGVYRSRLRHLETLQKKLEDEWGKQITGRSEE
jgi:hypothetical protein